MAEVEWWRIDQDEILESDILEIAERDGIPSMLSEVKKDWGTDWRLLWGVLLHLQQQKGYNKGWLAYKLEELSAPLEAWQQLGLYYGYKPGWAYHRFQELQEQQEQQQGSTESKRKEKRKSKVD